MKINTRRPAVMTYHRAKRKNNEADENKEYYRDEYIEFINRLMMKMRMDGIERMLEAALKETK